MSIEAVEFGAPSREGTVSYSRLVREYWLVILICGLLGLFAAYGFLSLRPAAYTSQTSILVSPTGVDEPVAVSGARTGGPLNMDTEAQIVLSDDVLTRAKAALQSSEPVQMLRGRVTVNVPPNTEILTIGFVTADQASSALGSTAVAKAYLAARDELAKKILIARTVALENQSTALQQQLVAAEAAVAGTSPTSPERPSADAQRSRVQSDLASSDSELSALKRIQVTPGQIVALPTTPTSDRKTIVLVSLFSGPFAGLLVGLGLALVLQRAKPRVREIADVHSLTNYPIVLRMPKGSRSAPVARSSTEGQAYARVRNQLMRMTEPPPRSVLVAAVTSSVTTHAVARNLAEVLVGPSGRATLVCTDLTASGLCEVGDSSTSPHVEVGEAAVERLRGASQMGPSLAEMAHHQGDMVVAHAPAFSVSSEAQTLSIGADVVLLVVEENVSVPQHLQDAVTQLQAVRAGAVGILLTPRGRTRMRPGRSRTSGSRDVVGVGEVPQQVRQHLPTDAGDDRTDGHLIPSDWPAAPAWERQANQPGHLESDRAEASVVGVARDSALEPARPHTGPTATVNRGT